jgi:hypothetical protein
MIQEPATTTNAAFDRSDVRTLYRGATLDQKHRFEVGERDDGRFTYCVYGVWGAVAGSEPTVDAARKIVSAIICAYQGVGGDRAADNGGSPR